MYITQWSEGMELKFIIILV